MLKMKFHITLQRNHFEFVVLLSTLTALNIYCMPGLKKSKCILSVLLIQGYQCRKNDTCFFPPLLQVKIFLH